MNIFALSRIPSECARFHNNKNYYNNDKRHLADWGRREVPCWYKL
jgi:hypothetical protein